MSKLQSEKKDSINRNNSQSRKTASRDAVITRFAPSPTGVLHIGGARTALFNYLFAKQNNGKFILRIEDTDTERSKKEYEEDIINNLKWLDLEWDEFYKQSTRKEIYQKYLQKLLDEDKAYFEDMVIRFRNPNQIVAFNDLIRGEIKFETTELEDFVIAKNLQTPLFHFAGAVDDFEMKVSHVIRGEDHISNTPRQILIQEAINAPRPLYAHIPLILGPDRSKLSKRHGAASLDEYRELGYLPEALINFLAFLGWNPGTDQEIFSMQELVEQFNLSKVQKSGAIFNIEKLSWINSQYIKKMDIDELIGKCEPYIKISNLKSQISKIKKIIKLKQERMDTLAEAGEGIEYFFEQPEYKKETLLWKQEKSLEKTKQHLEKVLEILKKIEENDFTSHNIKEKVWSYAEEQGRGNVLWPLRMALSGLEKSPEPFIISEILGKKETLNRIQNAIKKI
ncbi:glutamate--tRNA ligase [Patescibacteria group bacterium]|nr:glutamate--tRNA ligase [Patescibacteria group bacterium]MBU2263352.1 glutamate--tRNA ligase [Patescibacteria group bacterium]